MYSVAPDSTAREIRSWLRENPWIAKDKYEAQKGSVYGHCYVASEAYFYASGGEESNLDIYCHSYVDGTHWYLKRENTWIDLSVESESEMVDYPYQEGRRRAFITGYNPSQRAITINEELDLW